MTTQYSRYDEIESFREQNDFVYRVLTNAVVAKQVLMDLYKHISESYEPKKTDGSIQEPRQISEEDMRMFKSIAENPEEDINAAHTFFMFGLYLVPEFSQWILDEAKKKEKGPRLADPEAFKYFLLNCLSKKCEDLMSGKDSIKLDDWIKRMRTEYLITCGLPIPP